MLDGGVLSMPRCSCLVTSEQEAKLDQWQVWQRKKSLAPPGIEHHTVQPTASHYTDYAIPDSSLSLSLPPSLPPPSYVCVCVYIYIYTGCPRRKGPNFGRVFLRSNYTDMTQNTYIQS